ncbi:hypothetical protein CCACVL1_17396 [Corchorus capsularis]|uniref:Uncharacterized protein n=1 Tax=Corchorus capsularis TaxID=210143 RepID=A0A1R3HSI3_COCAP|nr:hypothetical protein CCACVL1_17396 [Corchorus capsularis]
MDWVENGETSGDPPAGDPKFSRVEDSTDPEPTSTNSGSSIDSPILVIVEGGLDGIEGIFEELSFQAITVTVKRKDEQWNFTTVYGSPTPSNREQLWSDLKHEWTMDCWRGLQRNRLLFEEIQF